MSAASKRGRVYVSAQKRRLLAEVERLCVMLDRPVCSKDLARAFCAEPDRQPILRQALGQVLIKAARPVLAPARSLHRVGILGNVAFYAPDEDPAWSVKLQQHFVCLQVSRAEKEQLPARASALFGTPFEGIARNALAGFMQEWSMLKGAAAPDRVSLEKLDRLLRHAAVEASPKFVACVPFDLVRREQAASMLRREYATRNHAVAAERQNVNRHLARLKWPQSQLFQQTPAGEFSVLQVRCYAAERWPQSIGLVEQFGSLSLCLRYGCGNTIPKDTDIKDM